MHFTIWALGAIVAAAQGLFLAAMLFSRKENRSANRLLGIMLLLLAITLVEWAFWWTGLIVQAPALKAVSFGFPLLYGPLMFFYYKSVFERESWNSQGWVHVLPFVCSVVLMAPFYLRFSEALAAALDWIPPWTRAPWFPVIIFAHMIGYGIWIGIRFNRYFWEDAEFRRWHRLLLAAYAGIVSTYLFYRLLPTLGLTAPEWKYLIAFSLTLFIYLVAWLGYIEPRVFAGMSLWEAASSAKYSRSSLTPEDSETLFKRVAELLEKEKLYRDNTLNLDQLAEKTGAQRHHISQAINEQAGKNFAEFINGYRIREARQLLANTSKKEWNIIEVAYQVGFNSKNTFNLVFKKHTGMTPTLYRQSGGTKR